MSLYAWIIDRDVTVPYGSTDEGVVGGHDAPARMVDQLKESRAYGTPFRMVDGDGEVIYLGRILAERMPKLNVDGEMHGDTAWDETLRTRMFPNTTLSGRANLFVMPNLDAANITYNMVRMMTDGVAIGPISLRTQFLSSAFSASSLASPAIRVT